MILLILKGGLGNQLFQLSFAEFLSAKYNKKIYVDTNYLIYNRLSNTKRKYSLDILQSKNHKKIGIINSLLLFISYRILIKFKFSSIKLPSKSVLYIDDNFKKLNLINNNTILLLNGYFQNFEFEKEIIRDFINNNQLINYKSKYSLSNKICVHIRRGDYLNLSSIYHTQKLQYFVKSMNWISSIIDNAKFIYFTDDPNWVTKNFDIDNRNSFLASSNDEIKDFLEMSSCDHFIISNSSYSLWAAMFLKKTNNKIVIYPSNWYVDESKNLNYLNTIIPENWISM